MFDIAGGIILAVIFLSALPLILPFIIIFGGIAVAVILIAMIAQNKEAVSVLLFLVPAAFLVFYLFTVATKIGQTELYLKIKTSKFAKYFLLILKYLFLTALAAFFSMTVYMDVDSILGSIVAFSLIFSYFYWMFSPSAVTPATITKSNTPFENEAEKMQGVAGQ